jgi:hypothetical protein
MWSSSNRPRHLAAVKSTFLCVCVWLTGCESVPFDPTPVVPTKNPLPYSASVKLTHVASYDLEPGSSLLADPNLQNHVVGVSSGTNWAKQEWQKSIVTYLDTRQTFSRVVEEGRGELDLALRITIYVDPGALFQHSYVYIARAEAAVSKPPSNLTRARYSGFGKAVGEVSRSGPQDDREPVNRAVHAALNDLLGKLETDTRLPQL